MTLTLDHVVIAVGYDLEEATAHFRALGFSVVYGGVHASGSTHNALIWFPDTTYLELLALTGNDAKPGAVDFAPMIRQSMVPGHSALVGYALRSRDLDADVEALRTDGAIVDAPQEGGRLRPDGTRLAWKNALVNHGYSPFLIEYLSPPDAQRMPADPLSVTHRNGVTRLCGVDYAAHTITVEGPAALTFDPQHTYGVHFQTVPDCA